MIGWESQWHRKQRMWNLFSSKVWNVCISYVIYKEINSCDESYFVQARRNTEVQSNEHNSASEN